MISGKNIICFASGWDFHPTSKHHVMRGLATRNHVIWVNWHASRRPGMRWGDLRTMGQRIRQIRRGAQRVDDAITVLTPWQVPLPDWIVARRLNAASTRYAIAKVLRHLPERPIQLWSFAPDVADLVGRFGEECVVYYCVDAFAEFPGYDRQMIARRERELLARSDVVLTTSRPLLESRRHLHQNVHLVEHGVDHARFSLAVSEELPVPHDLRGLRRPIIGYVGVIGQWVDLDLVRALAEQRPDASIVMIGPAIASREPCEDVPNVHWLGDRDHASLPAYLRCFDVGLIPFRHVALAHHANPIKLNEYLAAGVPVVSTPMPAVSEVPGAVWLADGATELTECCAQACEHNTPEDRRRRSESMKSRSWEARLEQISGIVQAAAERRAAHVARGSRPAGQLMPVASA